MVKNQPANAGNKRLGFDPWVRKIPWRGKWQPTPVFLPGEFHGQGSLVGYSAWGHKSQIRRNNYTTTTFLVVYSHFLGPITSGLGLSRWLSGKEYTCQCRSLRRHGFDPWVGKIPWRRSWQPTPVFLAWRIPWIEEPGGLQSTRSQRVGHNWSDLVSMHTHVSPTRLETAGGEA